MINNGNETLARVVVASLWTIQTDTNEDIASSWLPCFCCCFISTLLCPFVFASLSTSDHTSTNSPSQQERIKRDGHQHKPASTNLKEVKERLMSVDDCTGVKQKGLDCDTKTAMGESLAGEEKEEKEEPSIAAPPRDVDFFTEEEREKQIAKYINGRIIHADGGPACVPAGDSPHEIPSNFLRFYNGNKKQSMKAWREHQRWRKEREIWKIHTKPDPCFDIIKQAYPHVCHGRSKEGFTIMYENPGKINMQQMFHSTVKPDDILHHDIFVLEYCANVLSRLPNDSSSSTTANNNNNDASNDWGMMGVLDLRDLKSSEFLSREVFHYLSMISKVNDAHYPLHVKKVFMINAPFWLASAFKMIKPILPPSINIEILSSDYISTLRSYIDNDQLPTELGGSSPYKLGLHPMELDLIGLARNGATAGIRFKNVNPNKKSGRDIANTNKTTATATANNKSKEQQATELVTAKLENSEKEDSSFLSPSVNATYFTSATRLQKTTTTSTAEESQRNACLRHWPLPLKSLPSLCSTTFTASGSEDDGEDDDEEEKRDKDNDDDDKFHLPSYDRSFLIGKGPLRPRIPSFEPVLSADEEQRVIATFYSSALQQQQHLPTTNGDNNNNSKAKHGELNGLLDDEEGDGDRRLQEPVACEIWTTLLGGCG